MGTAIFIFAVSPGCISKCIIRIGCSWILVICETNWRIQFNVGERFIEPFIGTRNVHLVIRRVEPRNQFGSKMEFLRKLWNAAYRISLCLQRYGSMVAMGLPIAIAISAINRRSKRLTTKCR